jgi:hypothetical protein
LKPWGTNEPHPFSISFFSINILLPKSYPQAALELKYVEAIPRKEPLAFMNRPDGFIHRYMCITLCIPCAWDEGKGEGGWAEESSAGRRNCSPRLRLRSTTMLS